MIYIKRITNADITRQIDLTKETASSFFAFDPELVSQRSLEFLDELTNTSYSGSIKKSGHSTTITGDIFSFVKQNCNFGDIVVFSSTRSNTQFRFHVIKRTDNEFSGYDHALNLFGSRSGAINESTHLIASIDDEALAKIHKELDSDSDLLPYLTALRTKPFLLLAGISGTGKSRIVRELARACWQPTDDEYNAHKPRNFEMVQVKPNWHDSSELIGYVSRIGEKPEFIAGDFLKFVAKAWSEPTVPYFLCLDEMNLAPVEQYFAEYLSVIESRKLEDGKIVTDPLLKKEAQEWYLTLVSTLTNDENLHNQFLNEGITIPQNLFVVGTVNMDETTFSFSRKVLDRAMTIEMNEVDLKGGLETDAENEFGYIGPSEDGTASPLIPQVVEGKDVYSANKDLCDKVIKFLTSVNQVLDKTPFKIAYRTRNEFLVYAVCRGEENLINALDEMTSMKILSRIEGDADKTERVLNDLESLLKQTFEGMENSVSLAKIDEMREKLNRTQYTSFWS